MANISKKDNLPAQQEAETLANSQMFTNKVLAEFGNSVGEIAVTDYQRTLIQGYFAVIDAMLKKAEEDRIERNSKNTDHEKYDNPLPLVWKNVNLNALALDLVHYARLGLDMKQDNMLFPIPFRNTKRNHYDINLMKGYNGIRYVAEKYATESPVGVTVELVYSNDRFRPIKKSASNSVEGYEFEMTNAFNRGDIVGGFVYLEFDNPSKNKLIIMSKKDIDKRKPSHANGNFWKEDGWYERMAYKTLLREAYSPRNIPIDPQKVDDNYRYLKMREAQMAEAESQEEIYANANSQSIEIDYGTGEVKEITSESSASAPFGFDDILDNED